MTEPLIHMQAVKKVFVTDEVETHALEGIDLDVQRGEYISNSGPSGCGKSTLLAIPWGLTRFASTAGAYVLNGRPVQDLKPPANAPASAIGKSVLCSRRLISSAILLCMRTWSCR